jgi:hypothetical protein
MSQANAGGLDFARRPCVNPSRGGRTTAEGTITSGSRSDPHEARAADCPSKGKGAGHARFSRTGASPRGARLRRPDRAGHRETIFQLSRARRSFGRAGREPRTNGDQGRRPGDALCGEFLGMDRQLLRGAEDRRGHQSDQRDADAGRGRLRDQGLRRKRPHRQPRQDQAGARKRRA